MVAGEYAVLLPGEPCLVAAIDRRVTVDADTAAEWSVDTGNVKWSEGLDVPPAAEFVVAALRAMRTRYEHELTPHALRTSDNLHIEGTKLGLGGSAAATVAAVHALAPPHAHREDLWGIADVVHRSVQGGRGSGADVAASVHGGVLRFTMAQRVVAPIGVHPDVRLLLVWSGTSARTAARLPAWADFVRARPSKARLFASLSREAVSAIDEGLRSGDRDMLRGGVGAARTALNGLGEQLFMEMETEALKAACDAAWRAGGCGKISGAGGGDCAVVFAVGDAQAASVTGAIGALGLTVLPAPVALLGVHREAGPGLNGGARRAPA
jgi:phosphomevalonate kinase